MKKESILECLDEQLKRLSTNFDSEKTLEALNYNSKPHIENVKTQKEIKEKIKELFTIKKTETIYRNIFNETISKQQAEESEESTYTEILKLNTRDLIWGNELYIVRRTSTTSKVSSILLLGILDNVEIFLRREQERVKEKIRTKNIILNREKELVETKTPNWFTDDLNLLAENILNKKYLEQVSSESNTSILSLLRRMLSAYSNMLYQKRGTDYYSTYAEEVSIINNENLSFAFKSPILLGSSYLDMRNAVILVDIEDGIFSKFRFITEGYIPFLKEVKELKQYNARFKEPLKIPQETKLKNTKLSFNCMDASTNTHLIERFRERVQKEDEMLSDLQIYSLIEQSIRTAILISESDQTYIRQIITVKRSDEIFAIPLLSEDLTTPIGAILIGEKTNGTLEPCTIISKEMYNFDELCTRPSAPRLL